MHVEIHKHPKKRGWIIVKAMLHQEELASKNVEERHFLQFTDFQVGKIWFRRCKDGTIIETSGPGTPHPFSWLI